MGSTSLSFCDGVLNKPVTCFHPSVWPHLSLSSLSEWDVDTGKCLKTFKHKDPILATRINDTYIVSSCERGIVKVWHIVLAQVVKVGAVGCGGNGSLAVVDWRRLMVAPRQPGSNWVTVTRRAVLKNWRGSPPPKKMGHWLLVEGQGPCDPCCHGGGIGRLHSD